MDCGPFEQLMKVGAFLRKNTHICLVLHLSPEPHRLGTEGSGFPEDMILAGHTFLSSRNICPGPGQAVTSALPTTQGRGLLHRTAVSFQATDGWMGGWINAGIHGSGELVLRCELLQ